MRSIGESSLLVKTKTLWTGASGFKVALLVTMYFPKYRGSINLPPKLFWYLEKILSAPERRRKRFGRDSQLSGRGEADEGSCGSHTDLFWDGVRVRNRVIK